MDSGLGPGVPGVLWCLGSLSLSRFRAPSTSMCFHTAGHKIAESGCFRVLASRGPMTPSLRGLGPGLADLY